MNTLTHFLDTPKRFEISALLKPLPISSTTGDSRGLNNIVKLREQVVPLCQFQVPAQAKFGTLERLKRDKSVAKLRQKHRARAQG
jgi:hypothetical protein